MNQLNSIMKIESSDNYINVMTYGAIGDGATDDSSAIQAAIDAAHDADGGVVFFPPDRTFRIIAMTLYSNTTLMGGGPYSIITSTGCLTALIARVTGEDNITIRDLTWNLGHSRAVGPIFSSRRATI